MQLSKFSTAILLKVAVSIAITAGWIVPSLAQGALEEVVVTARKREESLQDVPISVNAVGGAKLEEAGIKRLEDLQALVPNFQLSETGISTQMYVRGIGTSNNQGFEQSVGQYVDGIYYGRQQLIRAPMFDLERVEVLRGPQSILFGKNSIAGALNLTTAKPTFERIGKVALTYNPDFGATDARFVFSQGITDDLAGRFGVRYFTEDGYVRNTTKNEDEVTRDDVTVRASLLWNPNDMTEWTFKGEWNQFDQRGRQIETILDQPSFPTSSIPNSTYSEILAFLGHPGGISETNINYERQADAGEKSDNTLYNFTLTGVFDLVSGNVFTSVTGYVEYEFDEICDCDFVGAPVFDLPMGEVYHQFSQELRIASPGGESIDWQAGIFFQKNDMEFRDMLRVLDDSILPQVSVALAPVRNHGAARLFKSDSELFAVFGETTFNIADNFRLTTGGRFTIEDKTGSRVANVLRLDPATGAVTGITDSPAAPFLFDFVFGFNNEQLNGHNLSGARSESSFTPSIVMQYDINDLWMGYVSASTGFKSGGYDARGNNIDSFEFDEEEATAIEIGAKGKMWDNRLELNVALYNTNYSDLQVSQFDGQIGFNVGNAGEVRARGAELDGRIAIADGWTGAFSAAYLDHEYTDFQNGNCYNRQVPDGLVVDGIPLCDYTGKSGQYTPKLTGSLSIDHHRTLNADFDLRVGADVSYSSKQQAHVNLDPLYEIDGYAKWNARVALEGNNWTFAISGLNLTDEKVLTYVGNHPLSGSTFQTNTFYGFVAPPRTLSLSATYDF